MNRLALSVIILLFTTTSFSQSLHVGFFAGISNYQGDLVDQLYAKQFTKAAGGINLGYEASDRIMLRAGFMYTKLTGNDKYNTKTYLQARNLNFQTSIEELSLVGEFYPFGFTDRKWMPYVFGGLGLYHFNPYTYDSGSVKVYLKPLSTEGEGLSQYPDRKPYSLTQFNIPFGGGVKYALNDNVRIGFEFGLRRLFTDYLDDVSTNYVDQNDLLAERGPQAVRYAYRGNEVPSGNPAYPAKGDQRGGAQQKDYYYLTGLTVSFRLGGGYGNTFASSGRKSRLGCPKVPL